MRRWKFPWTELTAAAASLEWAGASSIQLQETKAELAWREREVVYPYALVSDNVQKAKQKLAVEVQNYLSVRQYLPLEALGRVEALPRFGEQRNLPAG